MVYSQLVSYFPLCPYSFTHCIHYFLSLTCSSSLVHSLSHLELGTGSGRILYPRQPKLVSAGMWVLLLEPERVKEREKVKKDRRGDGQVQGERDGGK